MYIYAYLYTIKSIVFLFGKYTVVKWARDHTTGGSSASVVAADKCQNKIHNMARLALNRRPRANNKMAGSINRITWYDRS